MAVDGRSFLRGALFGSVAAIVALGLGAKAFAQTDLQQDPALHARNDVSEQATVLGGDWGTLHVEARDGQRIPASLSLSEVTRIAFENDAVVGVRSTQNGRPGAPLIEFEQDATTGDLYVVVAQGSANQVISAFATTRAGRTYHFLFTIREQPATQVFVRGSGQGSGAVNLQGAGRAEPRTAAILAFAHQAMNSIELDTETDRIDTVSIARSVDLVDIGGLEASDMSARIFELRNASDQPVMVIHDAFMAPGVIAVVSLLDQVPAGSTARIAVLSSGEAGHGGR